MSFAIRACSRAGLGYVSHTSHLCLLLLIHLCLARIQVLQCMRTRSARANHSGLHPKHCSSLCYLRPGTRYATQMHLWRHSRASLSSTLLGMTWPHRMTRAYTWMLKASRVWRVGLSHTSHHSAVEPRRGYRGAPCTCSQLNPPPPSSR
jgi:hypothetical protein